MPRPGGEADKLGNRYEGIWTVAKLLEVASGQSHAITVEPIGSEALGIEFVTQLSDGSREFHSAKRQRSTGEWSLSALADPRLSQGRSVLSDLCGKLSADPRAICCFVSSTGAKDLLELTERACRRATLADFEADLATSIKLRNAFERYLIPISTAWASAFEQLRRIRVVIIDEATLKRQVHQLISFLV